VEKQGVNRKAVVDTTYKMVRRAQFRGTQPPPVDPQLAANQAAANAQEVANQIAADVRRMAAAQREPVVRLTPKEPPMFHGLPTEDATDWLIRFEQVPEHNRWGPVEKKNNFGFCMEGTARKWYLSQVRNQPPWDTMRRNFEVTFRQPDHDLVMETKLRTRRQGLNESSIDYYFDVMHLCDRVDRNMQEPMKIRYLLCGLRPTLLEKMYPLQIQSCAEFLEKLQLFGQAYEMANRTDWGTQLVTPPMPSAMVNSPPSALPVSSVPVNAVAPSWGMSIEPFRRDSTSELSGVLAKLVEEMADLKKQVQQMTNKEGNRPNRRFHPYGPKACFACGAPDHLARDCPRRDRQKTSEGVTTEATSARDPAPKND